MHKRLFIFTLIILSLFFIARLAGFAAVARPNPNARRYVEKTIAPKTPKDESTQLTEEEEKLLEELKVKESPTPSPSPSPSPTIVILETTPTTTEPVAEPEPKKPFPWKLVLYIVGGIALLVGILFVAARVYQKTKEDQKRNF